MTVSGRDSGFGVAADAAARPGSRRVRPFYWSVRRELWASRWIYVAPVAAATVSLCGFLVALAGPTTSFGRVLPVLAAAHQHEALARPYHMASGFLMLVAMVAAGFYCVGALHEEQHDRTILFWKSLPVSDGAAVLAKAIIPIVFLPLLTAVIGVVLQSVMLLASAVVLWANGLDGGTLWTQLSFPRMTLMLLYHMLTIHVFCHAPFYGWLLFISAWARRAVFVWAVLPPFAVGALERIIFGTSHFMDMLGNRLSGGATEALTAPGTMPIDPMAHPTLVTFLLSPGLWIGLVLTGVFLAGSIRLRHYRGPIHG
jgi:ABC-2 type transport system permease protein